jgi:hypothetical protein
VTFDLILGSRFVSEAGSHFLFGELCLKSGPEIQAELKIRGH